MSGDPFKKVRPGERLDIPAPAWNACMDAARMARGLHGAAAVPQWRHSELVTVENVSEVDQGRFAVLGIEGPIFTPTENLHEFCEYVGLKVTTPATPAHTGRFVILAEPIAAGRIGTAIVSGTARVKLWVASGEDDPGYDFADVWNARSDLLRMRTHNAAAMILWREGGLGEKWAIVRLSNLCTTTA